MKLWPIIVGVGLGGVAIAMSQRGRAVPDGFKPEIDPSGDDDGDPGEKDDADVSTYQKPIIVGEATDPSVAPYLGLIATEFINRGIDIERMPVFPLVVMSKAPLTDGPDPDKDKTRPVAIPPKAYWPRMSRIAKIAQEVESQLTDIPARFTGYRPRDYNVAVGGAPNSKHIYGEALDRWLGYPLLNSGDKKRIAESRERMRMAYARYIVTHPHIKFGFGVYLNDIHIDTGSRSRNTYWERGAEYIEKAKKQLGVA